MKTDPPQSILQIHYHTSAGGVTKVINTYGTLFNRVFSDSLQRNVCVCDSSTASLLNKKDIEIVSIKECKYNIYRSKNAFDRVQYILRKRLEKLIAGLPRPLYIIGHNLSLGKNVALSAAFAEMTEQFAGQGSIRFFSVIHDLAEEGRIQLLEQIRYLESLGIPVWRYLYPHRGVRYLVLNRRNYTLFTRAGFATTLLPNPLDSIPSKVSLSGNERRSITDGLKYLSRIDKTNFMPSVGTLLYPVRVIARKNVLEAVIIACLLHRTNLLIGGRGTSRQDKKLYDRIKGIVQQYRLPVVFDIERLRRYLPAGLLKRDSIISLLYRYSDACISTSIAEGFGYTLFEPWLYDKAVIGRLPLGIASDEIGDFSHLYSRFEISVSLIPVKEILQRYYRAMSGNYTLGTKKEFFSTFYGGHIRKGSIDFGVLGQESQCEIVNTLLRICTNDPCNGIIHRKEKGGGAVYRFYGITKKTISNNRRDLTQQLTGTIYKKRFKECFYAPQAGVNRKKGDRKFFLRYFGSVNYFRLLMTPDFM